MENAPQAVLSRDWTSAPTALQSRMRQLQWRVEDCRQHLQAQNRSVSEICRSALELQAQAAALRQTLEGMSQRLQALGVRAAVPAPEPAASAPVPQTPPAVASAPGQAAPPRARPTNLLRVMPYLLILAAGTGLGLKGYALTLNQTRLAAPLPAPAERDPRTEALRLVYEYPLAGADKDVLDLVGTQEDVLAPSPWQVECGEDRRCEVSFLQGEAPLYEFAVDLESRSVTPSAETAARLLSATTPPGAAG